jgi:hypothetical protein
MGLYQHSMAVFGMFLGNGSYTQARKVFIDSSRLEVFDFITFLIQPHSNAARDFSPMI